MYRYPREYGRPWWSVALEMWLVQKSIQALIFIVTGVATLLFLMTVTVWWIARHLDEFPWGTTAAALEEVDAFLEERGLPSALESGLTTFLASWMIWSWFIICLMAITILAGLLFVSLNWLAIESGYYLLPLAIPILAGLILATVALWGEGAEVAEGPFTRFGTFLR